MRQEIFVLLLATTWSSAGTCAEPPAPKANAIDVATVESTTVLTSDQIAKIPVPRNITAHDCWGLGSRKLECKKHLPIEQCPVSADQVEL